MAKKNLTRFAWLSIGAAIATIALKLAAYLITDSVGLLSDALESFVNLAAALMALAMLTVAARDPDEMHAFGYSKAEYFSSGVEGALILLAAARLFGRLCLVSLRLSPWSRWESVSPRRCWHRRSTSASLAVAQGRQRISLHHAGGRRPSSHGRCLDVGGNHRGNHSRHLPDGAALTRSSPSLSRRTSFGLEPTAAPVRAWADGSGSSRSGAGRYQRSVEPV